MLKVDKYCTECEEITGQTIFCDECDYPGNEKCSPDCDMQNSVEYISMCTICCEPNKHRKEEW